MKMPKYKVETTKIDYCIEEEDIWYVDEDKVEDEIKRLKAELPQHLALEIECDEEDLEEIACNEISEKTGWLIYGFSYEIKEVSINA